jgi:hypothetical protein
MSLSYDNEELIAEETANPLDCVEEVITRKDWVFDRPSPDEISVQVSGRHGLYRLNFLWQEEYRALQLCCEYDLRLAEERADMAASLLRTINESMWLGHFDIPAFSRAPCFRHTSLMNNFAAGDEQIDDLIEIAIAECERYFDSFYFLAHGATVDQPMLDLALMPQAGEA